MATIKITNELDKIISTLTADHWEGMLSLAKLLDRVRPVGFTEQRELAQLQRARLIESCEGTAICAVAEKARDNYSN